MSPSSRLRSYPGAALLLAFAAFWMLFPRPPVQGQPAAAPPIEALFIEPGISTIRDPKTGAQMLGKLMIDKRNGDVWGFPTASNAPYPVAMLNKEPPISKPVYLGRFDLSAMTGQ